jgi:hypothetical protein
MEVNSMKSTFLIALVAIIDLAALAYIPGLGKSGGDQDIAPVLRGRALELVDSNGKMRAQINVESSGDVVLRLRDESGVIRVKLGASKSGSGMAMLNDSTEVGVHILATDKGSSLRVANKGGAERVVKP